LGERVRENANSSRILSSLKRRILEYISKVEGSLRSSSLAEDFSDILGVEGGAGWEGAAGADARGME